MLQMFNVVTAGSNSFARQACLQEHGMGRRKNRTRRYLSLPTFTAYLKRKYIPCARINVGVVLAVACDFDSRSKEGY